MSDCKFCRTTPNKGEDPVCATLSQAYEKTSARPYGCPWFDDADKERHPNPVLVRPAMTPSEADIERAAKAMALTHWPTDDRWKNYVSAARAALTAAMADCTLVPNQALRWLHGEGPDAEGKWFGEREDEVIAMPRKYTPRYWWRSKFRSMIPAWPDAADTRHERLPATKVGE